MTREDAIRLVMDVAHKQETAENHRLVASLAAEIEAAGAKRSVALYLHALDLAKTQSNPQRLIESLAGVGWSEQAGGD